MTSYKKALSDIIKSESFDKLDSYKDSKIWKEMNQNEKDLFTILLLKHGAKLLEQGDNRVIENFALAAEVGSYAPEIFYNQGLIFLNHPHNNRCLELATKAFEKTVQIDPTFLSAWYHLGQTSYFQGLVLGDLHFFTEAQQKFQMIENQVNAPSNKTVSVSDFYWQWGRTLQYTGICSGEPVEFYEALNKFRMAEENGCKNALFLNDYGDAWIDLSALLDNPEMLKESLKLFELALEYDSTYYRSWFNKAMNLGKLIELNPQHEWIDQAHESFERAADLNSNDPKLWLYWGRLEGFLGKLKRNQKLIESSFLKFAKAHELDPDNHYLLNLWGEFELFLGTVQEQVELIQKAKNHFIKSLEINSEISHTWYLYGSSLNELGTYFEDETYFVNAIEKFNYGLTLANDNKLIWYGLAIAYYSLGDMKQDGASIEKAVKCYTQIAEKDNIPSPQLFNDWAVALMKLGEMTSQQSYIQLAIDKFETFLRKNSDEEAQETDLEWVYNYGCAYDLLGDLKEDPQCFEKAISILNQVLMIDSTYQHARYNLALAYSHLGEITSEVEHYTKAIEQFQLLLEQDPEDEIIPMDFGITLVNLALLIQDEHQSEKAEGLFRQAELFLMQAASLGNSQAFYQLAGLYSLTEHFDLAMYYIERAQFFGTLPSVDDMMQDDWLEALRITPAFRQFLENLSRQPDQD